MKEYFHIFPHLVLAITIILKVRNFFHSHVLFKSLENFPIQWPKYKIMLVARADALTCHRNYCLFSALTPFTIVNIYGQKGSQKCTPCNAAMISELRFSRGGR